MSVQDKNIIITPNIGSATDDPKIVFSGADASTGAQNITLKAYPTSSGTLSFEGSAGQLFSITNSLSGTIYSVNDVSGIPSIEVLDTGLVKLAQYSGNVLVGTGTDNGSKFQLKGTFQNQSVWINDGSNYNGYNENIRLFNAPNNASTISFGATGTSGTPTTSIIGWADRIETRFGGTTQVASYNGYTITYGSSRSPLFYDSDNTAYYLDPASSSKINSLVMDGVLTLNASGNAIIMNGSSTTNIQMNAGGVLRGYMYSDSSGVGILTSAGTWAIQVPYGNTYSNILGSARSPIFYDYDNTGYYIDPNSTSNIYGLTVAATISGSISGNAGGNAATATTFSTNRTNYKGTTDGAVAGQLMWKNYGNNHTLFDASGGTSPSGGAITRYTPDYPITSGTSSSSWGEPIVLMGWNGANTYGVKVDWARYAESAGSVTNATNASYLLSPNGGTVVAADSAMPDAGSKLIYTLGYGPSNNDGHILGMSWNGTTTVYGAQLWIDTDPTNTMAFRSRSNTGVWNAWSTVWHSSNLTNLNQLTNGPGYITSESDTLATVTARGASTSTSVTFNNDVNVNGNMNFGNPGDTGKRGIQGTVGGNDQWFIGGFANANNDGYLEIATGDDGQSAGGEEAIYVSQYGPGTPLSGTLYRRATLLGKNGITQFPVDVRAPIFYDTGNTAYYINGDGTSNLNALITYSYQGNGNVGGTGSAAWFPSGFYAGNGNPCWLYGNLERNGYNTTGGGAAYYTILYDTNNTGYYCDPNSGSNFSSLTVVNSITVSSGNTTGNGIIMADDGDIVDLNDAYCSMRFSYGVRVYSANRGGSAVIALKNDGQIIANGNVTAYGSASDRTLKENVTRFSGALSKIRQLNGYYFNYIGDEDRLIGVIAQELEPVLPELVYEYTPIYSEEPKKAVKYELLTAVLIEGIKEQDDIINSLQQQLDSQQAQIDMLKSLINTLINSK